MVLSFVEFVGALKEPAEDGKTEFRQSFTVSHEGKSDLGDFINKAFQELAMLRGMLVHKKEPHERFNYNNQRFIPMERFAYIDCVVKSMVESNPPNPDTGDKPEEKVN